LICAANIELWDAAHPCCGPRPPSTIWRPGRNWCGRWPPYRLGAW